MGRSFSQRRNFRSNFGVCLSSFNKLYLLSTPIHLQSTAIDVQQCSQHARCLDLHRNASRAQHNFQTRLRLRRKCKMITSIISKSRCCSSLILCIEYLLQLLDQIPTDSIRKSLLSMAKHPCFDESNRQCLLQVMALINNLECLSNDEHDLSIESKNFNASIVSEIINCNCI